MKVKTAKLEGPALDWAVAKCESVECDADHKPIWFEDDGPLSPRVNYSPSTDGSQAVPIIEREQLSVYPFFIDGTFGGWSSCDPHHLKYDENGAFIEGSDFAQDGPTPLVAAMRCFVAHKLGEEVEVPDELVAQAETQSLNEPSIDSDQRPRARM